MQQRVAGGTRESVRIGRGDEAEAFRSTKSVPGKVPGLVPPAANVTFGVDR